MKAGIFCWLALAVALVFECRARASGAYDVKIEGLRELTAEVRLLRQACK